MSEETKHEELFRVVGRIYEESLARLVWKKVGRIFAWLPGLHMRESPLWLSSLTVLVLSALICATLAWLTGAMEIFSRAGLAITASCVIWMWLSINLADWQIRENLSAIQNDALTILKLPEGEGQVMEWVRIVTTRRTQVITAVSFLILTCTLSSFAMKLDFSQPLSWVVFLGLFLGTIWWVSHLAGFVPLALFYGYYFSCWPTSLFQDDPASTVSLLNLHRHAGRLLVVATLIAALSIPVGWIANMLTTDMLLTSGFALWIPMLVLYIFTERSFSVQIGHAKDKRLSDLQEQISLLEMQNKPPDVKTVELIQKLLEVHGKVMHLPNSLVNPESLLNLFGSLMLSLAGALVKIVDIWRQLFRSP